MDGASGVCWPCATVGDVMKLQDENRLIVKYGLKKIGSTKNTGLRMLVEKIIWI